MITDDDDRKIMFDSNSTITLREPLLKVESFKIERIIEDKNVEKLNLTSMPGFQFSWYFSGVEVKPELVDSYNRFKKFTR